MKVYKVSIALISLSLSGLAQAEEVRVRQADYWRGRPIAAHKAADYKRYSERKRYYASPYGWTSREPISRRQYQRLERRRNIARRYHARQLHRRFRR